MKRILQKIGWHNYRSLQGKSEICRTGYQEEQAGPSGHNLKLLFTSSFFFLKEYFS